VRVCVVTTSYPRSPDDVAGAFVAAQVEALRAAGVEVDVVSPADFASFGIAYGDGIVQNLRARPWLVAALPVFLVLFARAARRGSRRADVVHAHWLPSALPALATGKPLVVQVWGTDLELARRIPKLAGPLLRRARVVVAASGFLADGARALGARSVRVIPNGLALPAELGKTDEPPHILYVGRLSEEKGILELLEGSRGLPRVIVGDGPLRDRVPDAAGFVPPGELGAYYERAAVVCVPSRREGYGVVAREAMAHGRPVVATRVGGLADAVEDGVTGLLVPPGDAGALRAALERLLGDETLRAELGSNARRVAEESYSWAVATESLSSAYAEASRRTT
jgi:colanic acid/amylovoran biosynthesis glycosyltransferase